VRASHTEPEDDGAVIDVPGAARDDLQQRLSQEVGLRVTGWSPIAGGTQNRLFRLDTQDGVALLAKFYHRDRWDRLQREFSTLSLLGRHGLSGVPRVYVRSDPFAYGVYSFERGAVKRAADLTTDDLRGVAALAAHAHDIVPDTSEVDLAPAADASFSVADQLQVIDARLRGFETFAAGPSAYDEIRDLCRQVDLRRLIADLLARATTGLAEGEQMASLPRSAWRVNTGDFGPQNLLFTRDGTVTAVDFEAGGWDDPARLVMGFVAHATSADLTRSGVETFLAAYADARALSQHEIARFERVGALCDIEWIAIYATALTAEAVASKQFANREFNRAVYLAEAIDQLRRRLTRATLGGGYRFPAG
jgi:hypothetical protein